jgi:hypothetical protein
MVLEALLANERSGIILSAVVGVCSVEAESDLSLSSGGKLSWSRPVFLVGQFTFPFCAGTSVGADVIEELGAAQQFAVAQHHDAVRATNDAVQCFRAVEVKAVPNHSPLRSKRGSILTMQMKDYNFQTNPASRVLRPRVPSDGSPRLDVFSCASTAAIPILITRKNNKMESCKIGVWIAAALVSLRERRRGRQDGVIDVRYAWIATTRLGQDSDT